MRFQKVQVHQAKRKSVQAIDQEHARRSRSGTTSEPTIRGIKSCLLWVMYIFAWTLRIKNCSWTQRCTSPIVEQTAMDRYLQMRFYRSANMDYMKDLLHSGNLNPEKYPEIEWWVIILYGQFFFFLHIIERSLLGTLSINSIEWMSIILVKALHSKVLGGGYTK